MAKPKERQEEKVKSKKQVVPYIDTPASKNVENDQVAERIAFWNATIEQLSKQEFQTIDDAVHAVIGHVLPKVKGPQGNEQETREFLFTLLSTDGSIREQLVKNLRIKTK